MGGKRANETAFVFDNYLLKLSDRLKIELIEQDAIQRLIKTEPGDLYNKLALSQDLKAVYSMGYFNDVRIEAESTPEGMIVYFDVKEKPTLRSIKVSGDLRVFDEDEIKEVLTIRTGSILNFFKINNEMLIMVRRSKAKMS